MEKLEIMKLIGVCSANYRNWPEPDKLDDIVMLWQQCLSDIPYWLAAKAVEKHIHTSQYPPMIYDIRSKVVELNGPTIDSPIIAWGNVKKAIRRYGSYQEKEAIESLEPLTRKVVESIGFRYLCMSEDEMADRAHFTKAYEGIAERERKAALVPKTILDELLDNTHITKKLN